jgi:hypothetical protein
MKAPRARRARRMTTPATMPPMAPPESPLLLEDWEVEVGDDVDDAVVEADEEAGALDEEGDADVVAAVSCAKSMLRLVARGRAAEEREEKVAFIWSSVTLPKGVALLFQHMLI